MVGTHTCSNTPAFAPVQVFNPSENLTRLAVLPGTANKKGKGKQPTH